MNERTVRIFSTYNDFNEKNTSKTTLAALCVNLKTVIDAFETAEVKIRALLVDENEQDAADLKTKIQEARTERKNAIKVVLKEVHKKRSERDVNTTLEQFLIPSDLFKNVTDAIESTDPLVAEAELKITELKESLSDMENKLENADVELQRSREDKAKIMSLNGRIQELEDQLGHHEPRTERETKPLILIDGIGSTKGERIDYGVKLDSKTPTFRSKTEEDVEVWLDKIETALVVARTPKQLWIHQVTNYVEGTAYEMVRAARKANHTWDTLRAKLVATFKASYKDFRLRAKFRAIKDTGNFEKYLHDFRLLSNQISPDDLTEKDRLDVFIQGLRPRTQGEMFMRNVKNLEDAILLATTLENIVSTGPRTSDVNFVKVNKPQYDKKPSVKLFLGKCNRCHRVGHKEANCYKDKLRPTSFPTKTTSFRPIVRRDKINMSQIECFICHKRGHFASKCGKPSSTSPSKFYNKPVQSNIVEVNMIEILGPEQVKSKCNTAYEEYQAMYDASIELDNNWLKYDFFVFNVVCHDSKDFCTECLSLNAVKDRLTQAPQKMCKALEFRTSL